MHKHFKILLGVFAMVVIPVLTVLSPLLVQDAHAAELKIIMEDGWGSNDITAGYNPLVSDTGYWGSYRNLNFTVKVDGVTGKAISVTADIPDAVTISTTSTGFDLKTNDNPSVSKRYINITVKVLDPALEYTFYIAQEATGFGTGCPYSACLVENGNYIPADGYGSPVYTFGSAGGSRTYDKIGHFDDIYSDPDSPCKISITSQTDTRITITAIRNTSNGDCTAGLGVGGAPPLYTFTQPRYFDDDGNATPTPPDDPNNPEGNSGGETDCEAGKFGWALCPIMEGIDEALGGLYGIIEENFLQVDIEFYRTSAERVDGKCPSGTSETDSGTCESHTYRFWKNFRNIANVVFVIVFLIIILSQVTSVGISNYGIKKMLPEIIIAALLINLSYFICQAMVDVSNIVGVSIRDFLSSIVPGSSFAALANAEGTQSFLNVVAGLAGVAAVGFSVTTILAQGVFGLIAAILVVLLTALVAIFMMFVILVVRQIAVILLIVLAPLAFAARILPNTANLFKSWWKAFSSLLVVYPICSLVIGLGAAAATIMGSQIGDISTGDPNTQASLMTNLAFIGSSITSGNFGIFANISVTQGVWIAATVLAMVVPYFAVIPICKGALNGLGKLGGMITGKVQGAGAGINRLGLTGATAAQKKYDQSASRQARLASAKLKAQGKAATKASDNRGTLNKLTGGRIATTRRSAVDRMMEDQYNNEQKQDAASLASLGQYVDDGSGSRENRRLMRISAAKAKSLGVNPDGTPNGTRTFSQDSWEGQQQMAALTARQQQDAKTSKQFSDQFAAMAANGDVEAAGKAALADGNHIQAEQAINDLLRRGDIKAATKLTRAYTNNAHYENDTRAQQRLANILQTGENKKNAARLWSLGKETNKAIAQGNKKGITLDSMTSGTGVTYKDASGTAIGGSARTLQAVLHDDFSVPEVAGQDKDTFEDLSSLGGGNNFSADKYVGAYTSGAAVGKITQINAAVRSDAALKTSVAQSFTGSDINKLDNDAYAELSSDFSDKQFAGALTSGGTVDQIKRNNAALAASPAKMEDTAKLINATQMQNLDDSSFVMMAKHQLQATYAADPAKLTALSSAATIGDLKAFVAANAATAQPVLQGTFSSAYNSAKANKDVAKHWNADIQNVLGV
jgi:hypothetical protein